MGISLGIFAGGFKPFTTGHFSKLALASDENDEVLLLYGLSERKKGSDYVYTREMAEQIYGIVSNAVEREMPNVNVVQARPSPIAASFDVIDQVANGSSPKHVDLTAFGLDPGSIDSIVVYSDPEDIQVYLRNVGGPNERKYFGDMASTGRLRFDTGLSEDGSDERIIDALTKRYRDAHPIDAGWAQSRARVRGSEIRSMIQSGMDRELASFLPPVLNQQELADTIAILKRDINESMGFFDRYLRFLNESEGPEAHILGFHEDLGMSVAELKEAIRALLEGGVEDVQEKLDGQNLTFTVRNGRVETLTKGATWARASQGGRRLEDYDAIYADRPTVRDAFKMSHAALQAAVDSDPSLAESVFQNGGVVVEASMMLPSNPNTIIYDVPRIVFIGAHALDPALEGRHNERAYRDWVGLAKSIKDVPVGLTDVPILKLQRVLDSDRIAANLESELDALMQRAGLDPGSDATLGDVMVGLTTEALIDRGLDEDEAGRGAKRMVLGLKRDNPQKSFSPESWRTIRELESGPFLNEVRIPLERIIQKLATTVFRNLEFALASNDAESGRSLRDFVARVRVSMQNERVLADPAMLRSIRTALDRIGDEAEFEKAVEGVVFRWKGKTRKLTGLFTPINKLRGFFHYGKEPARMLEARVARKVMSEIARRNGWAG
jgi:hypothetical protein